MEYNPGDDSAHIELLAEEDLKDYDNKDKDYVKEIKENYKRIFHRTWTHDTSAYMTSPKRAIAKSEDLCREEKNLKSL